MYKSRELVDFSFDRNRKYENIKRRSNLMKRNIVKLVVLSSLVFLSSIAHCQSYDLNINLCDGTTVTIAVDDIQRIEFGNVSGIEDTDEVQPFQNFQLMQNYPNPFNPSATIEYQIPKTADVVVSIFNIRGQLVKELLNETQSEGVHQVAWNGTNQNNEGVSSGIYFYTVKSDELILSKKMVLLK